MVKLNRFTLASSVALSLIVAVLSGCGGGDPNAPPPAVTGNVHGKVTYKGAPVTDGQVVFTSLAMKTEVVGELTVDGSYRATNLPQGDFAVRVTAKPAVPSMDLKAPKPKPADPANIPKKYRNAKSSGLHASINRGDNNFDISMQ